MKYEPNGFQFIYAFTPNNPNRSTDEDLTIEGGHNNWAEQLEQQLTNHTQTELDTLAINLLTGMTGVVDTKYNGSNLMLRNNNGDVVERVPEGSTVTYTGNIKRTVDNIGQSQDTDGKNGLDNTHAWFEVSVQLPGKPVQTGWMSGEYIVGEMMEEIEQEDATASEEPSTLTTDTNCPLNQEPSTTVTNSNENQQKTKNNSPSIPETKILNNSETINIDSVSFTIPENTVTLSEISKSDTLTEIIKSLSKVFKNIFGSTNPIRIRQNNGKITINNQISIPESELTAFNLSQALSMTKVDQYFTENLSNITGNLLHLNNGGVKVIPTLKHNNQTLPKPKKLEDLRSFLRFFIQLQSSESPEDLIRDIQNSNQDSFAKEFIEAIKTHHSETNIADSDLIEIYETQATEMISFLNDVSLG